MIVQRQLSLRSFAGDWENWCDNKFASDPGNLQKCKSQPLGPFTLAPWTDVGAIQRGIPKPSSLLVSAVTARSTSSANAPEDGGGGTMEAGIFGVPHTMFLVGGLVLAGGLGLSYLMKHKRRGRR